MTVGLGITRRYRFAPLPFSGHGERVEPRPSPSRPAATRSRHNSTPASPLGLVALVVEERVPQAYAGYGHIMHDSIRHFLFSAVALATLIAVVAFSRGHW